MAETDPKPPSVPEETTQRDTSQVEISLKYDGSDVRDGTMQVEDVISALRGFSAAYGKLAAKRDPNSQHDIRVSNVEKSSFAVVIMAWVKEHPGAIAASGAAVQWIVATIIQIIKVQRATKGRPANQQSVTVGPDGFIINAGDNARITMTKEVYEVYLSASIDQDIAKIVAPLEKDHIDEVMVRATSRTGFSDEVRVTAAEREFFQAAETVTTTTSRPTTVEGSFVSLNKESNRGMFKLQSGRKVPYRFAGDNIGTLHADFAYKGHVRADCIATFDDNLEVRQLEITRVTRLQLPLFEQPPGR